MHNDNLIERKTYPEGASIFREGDPGATAYIIQEGVVGIHKSIDGKEKILATVSKGAIFGEMALIDKKPRTASARALEPTTVIVVSEAMFNEKIKKADPFIRGLLGILVDTVRNQNS
ncbi:MAG: cyclic nucleotide-binding domain-containing protein [Rhodospirillaceae bacterium]|nr:cyclic nucleotide-binding domain-containing protein [Rhodospirillaceae bacterium]